MCACVCGRVCVRVVFGWYGDRWVLDAFPVRGWGDVLGLGLRVRVGVRVRVRWLPAGGWPPSRPTSE